MTFEVYQDAAGEYRWRLKEANGRIMGDSGQGYTRKGDCYDAIGKLRLGVPHASIQEVQG